MRTSRDELAIARSGTPSATCFSPGASVLQTRRVSQFVPVELPRRSNGGCLGRVACWAEVRARWGLSQPATRSLREDLSAGLRAWASRSCRRHHRTGRPFRPTASPGTGAAWKVSTRNANEPTKPTSFAGVIPAAGNPTLPRPPNGFFEFHSMTIPSQRRRGQLASRRIADSVRGKQLGGARAPSGASGSSFCPVGTTSFVSLLSGDCGKPRTFSPFSRLAMHCAALDLITCSSQASPAAEP